MSNPDSPRGGATPCACGWKNCECTQSKPMFPNLSESPALTDELTCVRSGCGRPRDDDVHHDRTFRVSVGLPSHAYEPPAVAANPAPEETPLCEITSDDLEALSHGLTLLGEMSRLTRNPEVQNDSISVHWHEKDGERAGAAFAVLRRIYQAHRAALTTATDVGLRQIALAAKVAMLRAECDSLRATLEEEKARLDWLDRTLCTREPSGDLGSIGDVFFYGSFASVSLSVGDELITATGATVREIIDAARGSSEKREP